MKYSSRMPVLPILCNTGSVQDKTASYTMCALTTSNVILVLVKGYSDTGCQTV